MDKIRLNKINQGVRRLSASVMIIFVLLLSCPIKHDIKDLAGIPVNTESSSAKKAGHLYVSNSTGQCAPGKAIAAETIRASLTCTDHFQPTALFTGIFSFISRGLLYRHRAFPNRRHIKAADPVPTYLRHGQFLI